MVSCCPDVQRAVDAGAGTSGTTRVLPPKPNDICSRRSEVAYCTQFVDGYYWLQDLHFLSDGLEGRTSNPLALLFDALSNPHADVGAQLPSSLRWEFHPEREIPHVVLGRYDEGGTWQVSGMIGLSTEALCALYFIVSSLEL